MKQDSSDNHVEVIKRDGTANSQSCLELQNSPIYEPKLLQGIMTIRLFLAVDKPFIVDWS